MTAVHAGALRALAMEPAVEAVWIVASPDWVKILFRQTSLWAQVIKAFKNGFSIYFCFPHKFLTCCIASKILTAPTSGHTFQGVCVCVWGTCKTNLQNIEMCSYVQEMLHSEYNLCYLIWSTAEITFRSLTYLRPYGLNKTHFRSSSVPFKVWISKVAISNLTNTLGKPYLFNRRGVSKSRSPQHSHTLSQFLLKSFIVRFSQHLLHQVSPCIFQLLKPQHNRRSGKAGLIDLSSMGKKKKTCFQHVKKEQVKKNK